MFARSALLTSFLPLAVLAAFANPGRAQDSGPVPSELFDTLDWRLIGPFRGGRVDAVTGVAGDRNTYFMGTCGGGVWKTTDAGVTWSCISDGTFGGSIGAIAIAPSNAKVIYVGGGESTWRGNVSSGDGMWKSTDGGATWVFSGLPDSRHISRIVVHPQNAELVYAAVMGHVSGASEERGVYRSKDGGGSWQRVLFANRNAGAFELCMAPNDANTLYATTWRAVRTPWSLESGGEGSGLWKSVDGGDTWVPLHEKKGMPKGVLGIIGICASPAEPKRLYAQVEAEAGGMFRSEDAGETWVKVNEDRALRQRAWYYSRVYADPKNRDVVYVLNVSFLKSVDGGKTFAGIGQPHSDNHDLWIDPNDGNRMIEANDGGACVSNDGGKTWSSLDNQPTAQFYRVALDDAGPYRIYGAQQDNSTVRIAHCSRGDGIGNGDWQGTAGGESGWLAPKPGEADVVFGGNYDGYLVRLDHRTGISRRVDVWPDNPMGAGAADLKYRFQWSFPIQWSQHDRSTLYTAAQVLFASRDDGHAWTAISGDLTRNDKSKMGSSGGPITKDNTSVEYYGTIFTLDEGRQPGVIWTGSDDGLVQLTRDGGKTWANVTPPGAPEWLQINCIAADPHQDGGCYVAATRYKLDDFQPYLYATTDFGATWREIVGGLDRAWFTRTIRPDPVVPGLLYCGTERTVWVSFDDGRRWQKLTRNLPSTPITDLIVRGTSLIAATQGRAFWSFDGLDHLRGLTPELAQRPFHVFPPLRVELGGGKDEVVAGKGRNPSKDLQVRFLLGGSEGEPMPKVEIEVKDPDGNVVCRRSTEPKPEAKPEAKDEGADDDKKDKKSDGDDKDDKDVEPIAVKRGMNAVRLTWRGKDAKILDGMILWNGRGRAPRTPPGDYTVTVKAADETQTVSATLLPDPRAAATVAELQARHRLVRDGNALVTEAHEAIASIRSLKKQMRVIVERADGDAKTRLEAAKKAVDDALTPIEEALYQTKSKSEQDPLNYPIRLTDKLLGVLGSVEGAEFGPTAAQVAVAAELSAAIRAQLDALAAKKKEQLAAFNALAHEFAIPHVK
jgi:photosystem II stability/assembly factor-like uncharacterized protein